MIDTTSDDTYQELELSIDLTPEGAVELEWPASSENELMGYYVYRGTTDDLDLADPVNDTLIPAMFLTRKKNYTYTDDDVEKGKTYWYWLAEVDEEEEYDFFGPASITVE